MFRFKSLTAKFISISIIVLTFLVVYLYIDISFTHHMKGEATKINLAGRQRMLTISFSYNIMALLFLPQTLQKEMSIKNTESRMAEYEEVFYGLRDGSKKLGIKPLHKHDKESISQLGSLIEFWESTQKPALLYMLKLPPERKDEACGMCHSAIRDNIPLLEIFVESIEKHYDKEIKDFDTLKLYVLGFFFVGVGFVIFFVRRGIVKPILRLKDATTEIEKGSLDVRVDVKGRDEIGTLGNTFNSMAQHLKGLIAENARYVQRLDMLASSLAEAQRVAHIGSWQWDIVNNKESGSDEIYRIFGLSPQEFGRTYEAFLNCIHPDDREFVKKANYEALYEKKPYYIDFRIVLPDASERVVHAKAELAYDVNGNPVRIIGIVQDITERKQLEDALQKFNEELIEKVKERTKNLEYAKLQAEEATRAKSDFLANMSHELRTPLNSIIGFAEVLRKEMAGPVLEEQKEYLKDIWESGKHLLRLINDILDLSKIEAGKMELELSEFDIGDLIKGCLILFKEKSLRHAIRLSSEVPEDIGSITADERKIKQVILNLLGNAFKFTPDGGKVGIEAVRTEKELHLTVWDTGIGIAEKDIGRLFKPFEQLETILTKKYEGTGLGLNLCQRFLELHGGKIWVESEVGKGSRFIFAIPLKQ